MLSPDAATFVAENVARIVAELGPAPESKPVDGSAAVCITAAHDSSDHAAAQMVARLLAAPEFASVVLAHPMLAAELLQHIEGAPCRTVLVCGLPPRAAKHAEYLCRRLRQRFPEIRILVGLWAGDDPVDRAVARLKAAGATEVVTTLSAAVERMRQHAPFGAEESHHATT
jgi:hypothetical protein